MIRWRWECTCARVGSWTESRDLAAFRGSRHAGDGHEVHIACRIVVDANIAYSRYV